MRVASYGKEGPRDLPPGAHGTPDMASEQMDEFPPALDALLGGRMASVSRDRDWPLLREIAALAKDGPPPGLDETDPDLHDAWCAAVTRFRAAGWGHMTPERVDAVAIKHAPVPTSPA